MRAEVRTVWVALTCGGVSSLLFVARKLNLNCFDAFVCFCVLCRFTTLVGTNFGPVDQSEPATFVVSYGSGPGTSFPAVGCARVPGFGNTRLRCRTTPGSGGGLRCDPGPPFVSACDIVPQLARIAW